MFAERHGADIAKVKRYEMWNELYICRNYYSGTYISQILYSERHLTFLNNIT